MSTTRPKGPPHRPRFAAKHKGKHQIDKKHKARQQPQPHHQHKDKRRTPPEERGLPSYARRKLHEKPKEAENLIAMPRHKVVRKWEVHPGKNTFCCDGRLLMAKQAGIFYLTIALILITSAMSFIGDMPYLATEVSPVIPVIGAVLFIFTFSNLFKTSFSDPGIIPRATKAEAWDLEHQIELQTNSNGNAYRPPPRSKDVQVKNQTIKLKYCFTCKIFRPPRASHCSVCDNCVEQFDHHCPWVGNCIGKRNYRYFYFFLVSIAFYCVFIFACALTHLLLEARGDGQRSGNFIDAIRKSPSSIICIVITFFSVWSILGLTGFHTYLTSSNLTTNEDLKGAYSSKRNHDNYNPFSDGNACSNCFSVLCGPMPPSLIDPHGKVTEEFVREYGITIPGMAGNDDKQRRANHNGQTQQPSYGAAGNERTPARNSSDRSDFVVASTQDPVSPPAVENGDLDQTTMIGSALDLDDVDSGEPNDADAVNSQASASASHAGSQVGLLKLSAV